MNYLPRKSRVLIEMCSTLGEECKDNPRAIGQQVQLQNWEMRCLHRKAHLVISLKAICVWTFSEPSRLSYYNHPSYIVDLDIIWYYSIHNLGIANLLLPISARLKPRPAPAWPDWLARHQTRTSPVGTAAARWKRSWKPFLLHIIRLQLTRTLSPP